MIEIADGILIAAFVVTVILPVTFFVVVAALGGLCRVRVRADKVMKRASKVRWDILPAPTTRRQFIGDQHP